MWSFNREGELEEAPRQARDAQMQIDKGQKMRSRADLPNLAHPQVGVDARQSAFPDAKAPPPRGARYRWLERTLISQAQIQRN
jgi:hypothetical protein